MLVGGKYQLCRGTHYSDREYCLYGCCNKTQIYRLFTVNCFHDPLSSRSFRLLVHILLVISLSHI